MVGRPVIKFRIFSVSRWMDTLSFAQSMPQVLFMIPHLLNGVTCTESLKQSTKEPEVFVAWIRLFQLLLRLTCWSPVGMLRRQNRQPKCAVSAKRPLSGRLLSGEWKQSRARSLALKTLFIMKKAEKERSIWCWWFFCRIYHLDLLV